MKATFGNSVIVLLFVLCALVSTLVSSGAKAQDLPLILADEVGATAEAKGPVRYVIPEEQIVANVPPSVVKLMVRLNQGDNTIGTGFFAGDGLIITTAHVLAGQPIATVKTSQGESFDARVVASDPQMNLVLMRAAQSSIPYLPLGRPSHVEAGNELIAVTWPNIGSPRDIPLTVPRFLQFPNEMTVRKTKVLVARQMLPRAQYWDTSQSAMVVDLPMKPEWSGSPLIDQYGEVVAVCMGVEPAAKQDKAATQRMPYTVRVEMFQGLPPVVMESSTEPPAIPKDMSPEERTRIMNLWRVWLMKASVTRVPRIEMGGKEVPLTENPQQIESFLLSLSGGSTPNVRQVPAGQAGQRTARASVVDWLFRQNQRIPSRFNVEFVAVTETLPLVPQPEGASFYAIPIGAARRAFRGYLP